MYLPYESSPMSALSETIVAKFGGRISLNFRPQTREIFYSPLGRFFDCAEKLNFGILYDGVRYALPFGNGHTDFQYTEQHEYFDRVVFVCRDYRIGVRAEFSFIAPFYPQDEALCTLPALFCEVKAERLVDRALRADDRKEIAIFCDVRMSGFKECGNCLKMRKTYGLTDDHIHYQDTEGWNAFLRQNRYTSHTFRADSAIVCREKSRPVQFHFIMPAPLLAGYNFCRKFSQMAVAVKEFFRHILSTSFPSSVPALPAVFTSVPELQIPADQYRTPALSLSVQEEKCIRFFEQHPPLPESLSHGKTY